RCPAAHECGSYQRTKASTPGVAVLWRNRRAVGAPVARAQVRYRAAGAGIERADAMARRALAPARAISYHLAPGLNENPATDRNLAAHCVRASRRAAVFARDCRDSGPFAGGAASIGARKKGVPPGHP